MKIDLKFKIFLSILIIVGFPIISMASEEITIPDYTEEYKKWMELSPDEKQNAIEPQMYEVPKEIKENNEIQIFSTQDEKNVGTTILPTKFTDRKNIVEVKNQESTNTCWAQSSASVFEENYYIKNSKKINISEKYMDYITARDYNSNGFYRTADSGGNMNIALAYATNGMGIVPETNATSQITLNNFALVNPSYKVSDYEILYDSEVKEYIYKYGVVSGYTYMNTAYFSSSNYANNNNLAYYCSNSNLSPNHAITLIGWDDNYTNTAFPGLKGAYLVLNSYGTNFGDNGCYYIFYDDVFIKDQMFFGVTKTDDINYGNLYQYDEYGQTATLQVNSNKVYLANVYKRENSNPELLTELGIYFPIDESVTIYINPNNDNKNISSATMSFSTKKMKAGYHTIKLPEVIKLNNNKFTVCVEYSNNYFPLELSDPNGLSWYYTVDSNFGESYLSTTGKDNWNDLKKMEALKGYSSNACIKAFTENLNEENKLNIEYKYSSDLEKYVFDYQYYANHNLDLYNTFGYNKNALKNHWEKYGKSEGRASSPIFDVKYYIQNNSDLSILGNDYISAYNHFMNYGYAEFRKSSPEYDGNYYRKNNGDLAQMNSMELIRHYSLYGRNELRKANTNYDITSFLFDATIYAQFNQDVVNALGNNAESLKKHWYNYGINEGRIASLIFDAKYYLKINKDVANVYGATNYGEAYNHFVNCGFSEGRDGNAVFSVKYYLEKNKDLTVAFGKNYLKAVNHFIVFGKTESRLSSSLFNVITYKTKNLDLKNAFKENYENYYVHYLRFGQNEKRICL